MKTSVALASGVAACHLTLTLDACVVLVMKLSHDFKIYFCPFTYQAWQWASNVIHQLEMSPMDITLHNVFSTRSCLFDELLLFSFKKFRCIWYLICRLVPWIIWKARDVVAFNNERWTDVYLCQVLHISVLEYGKNH